MPNREWTQAEDDIIARMRHGGSSLSEIGNAIGRTRNSVRARLRQPLFKSTVPEKNPSSAENKRLKAERDQLAEALETARKPRVKLPSGKHAKQKGDFVRLIIPDTHGCQCEPAALAAMLADAKAFKPREIVMLGDHLECGGFLAEHHTLSYVAQAGYTFEQDVAATNQFLDELQTACPRATIHYIEGNHERRIETFCITKTLRNQADAGLLRRMFSTESVLSLKQRGINWYRQGVWYMGLPIPATIKLGHCHFTHGHREGAHAAAYTLNDFGGNVVFGHTHTKSQASRNTVKEGEIGAWNPGCLCVKQPMWGHTRPTNWSHGYGLQFVRENGDFLHINVPIIDGKSYLVGLARLVA